MVVEAAQETEEEGQDKGKGNVRGGSQQEAALTRRVCGRR